MSTDKDIDFLLLGGSGLLGSAFSGFFATAGEHAGANVYVPNSRDMLANPARLADAVRRTRRAVINCIAYTAVDMAEEQPAEASHINAALPAQLARLCADASVRLVHFSTDYVFNGAKREPYTEDDYPEPLNIYGSTKLAGERAVRAVPNNLVLRISTLYHSTGKSFVAAIVNMLAMHTGSEPVAVLAGLCSAPTAVDNVVAAVDYALARGVTGLHHITDGGPGLSRYAFAELIGTHMGGCAGRLKPTGPDGVQAGKAVRPAYSVMRPSPALAHTCLPTATMLPHCVRMLAAAARARRQ